MIDNHKTRVLKAKIQEFFESKLILEIKVAIAQTIVLILGLAYVGFCLAIIYKVFNYFR